MAAAVAAAAAAVKSVAPAAGPIASLAERRRGRLRVGRSAGGRLVGGGGGGGEGSTAAAADEGRACARFSPQAADHAPSGSGAPLRAETAGLLATALPDVGEPLQRAMTSARALVALLAATAALLAPAARAFPDGAPVDACVKERPNQPYHGQARPQPPQTNPYSFVATDSYYQPGSKIAVTVDGGPYNATFRGFFLQARDAASNAWVGAWDPTPGTSPLPECAAITHGDNRDKLQATLVWSAPPDAPPGQVYFTGAVVKKYDEFWIDMVANVLQH
ncbi:Putative defense protein 3 [Gryllus bimaculatus]|nr:Putative defense protein 3 [Gryllus bimaculatus]